MNGTDTENGKRKHSSAVFSKAAPKLRKITLNAFASEDDDFNTSKNTNLSTDSNISYHMNDELTGDQKDLILKTATWVSNNPDKAAVLIERSVNNPMLFFLKEDKCLARILYTKELARLRTEKEVQNICGGGDSVQDTINLLNTTYSTNSTAAQTMQQHLLDASNRISSTVASSL